MKQLQLELLSDEYSGCAEESLQLIVIDKKPAETLLHKDPPPLNTGKSLIFVQRPFVFPSFSSYM